MALAEGAPKGKRSGNYRHGQSTNEGRRIMARLNYLGRMLARIRREETLCLRLSKKYDGKWPLLGVVERIEFARSLAAT
jgi:hypothetical protein